MVSCAFRTDSELVDDGGSHSVLMQDDSLISEISVIGDNLLLLPGSPRIGASDAFLVIDVQLEVAEPLPSNAAFRS